MPAPVHRGQARNAGIATPWRSISRRTVRCRKRARTRRTRRRSTKAIACSTKRAALSAISRTEIARGATLANLSSKTATAALAEISSILRPLIWPARMPNMRLSPTEAEYIRNISCAATRKFLRCVPRRCRRMPSKSEWGDLLSDKKSSTSNDDEFGSRGFGGRDPNHGRTPRRPGSAGHQRKCCAACHEFTPPGEKETAGRDAHEK